jgi:RNA polymerase sigma-70 factor (ECF subfamily)
MTGQEELAERFEQHRGHLRSVALRMLGSAAEADDAVQEAWLRLSRAGDDEVDDLRAWLTTVVARLCLNLLRARATRREDPLLPDPVIAPPERVAPGGPEDEAVLADSVGVALLVVLDTLSPAERLAFVLHDLFGMPFEEIAPMIGRAPAAARQLASRGRRKVRGADTTGGGDPRRRRVIVEAFFAAARSGDFDRLMSLLDPDVVLRSDGGTGFAQATALVRGAAGVAGQAMRFAQPAAELRPATVNGQVGVVVLLSGQVRAVMSFRVVQDRIVAIDALADPDRLAGVDLAVIGPA